MCTSELEVVCLRAGLYQLRLWYISETKRGHRDMGYEFGGYSTDRKLSICKQLVDCTTSVNRPFVHRYAEFDMGHTEFGTPYPSNTVEVSPACSMTMKN